MQITEVKVFPVSEDKLKAFVSIVLDRCFMVNDIKVIRGKDGLFISMPSRKKKNGEFKDVAHPLNNETRQRIENEVLDEYERILRERGEEPEVGRRQLDVEPEEPAEDEVASAAQDVPERETAAPRPAVVAARRSEDEREADAERGQSPPPAVADAGARPQPAEPAAREEEETEREEEKEDRSLEEIQERHLRDSFWSVS